MEKQKSSVGYAPEVRERAVRIVLEHAGGHASQWEAIGSIAAKIGCSGETRRKWVRQAERDHGLRAGPTSAEQARINHPASGGARLRLADPSLSPPGRGKGERAALAPMQPDRKLP